MSFLFVYKGVKKIEHFVISVQPFKSFQYVPNVVSVYFCTTHFITQLPVFIPYFLVTDQFVFFLGKSKCMAKTGDCVVKHPSSHAIGMGMVVSLHVSYSM